MPAEVIFFNETKYVEESIVRPRDQGILISWPPEGLQRKISIVLESFLNLFQWSRSKSFYILGLELLLLNGELMWFYCLYSISSFNQCLIASQSIFIYMTGQHLKWKNNLCCYFSSLSFHFKKQNYCQKIHFSNTLAIVF